MVTGHSNMIRLILDGFMIGREIIVMETNHPYFQYTDSSDGYMEWVNPSFPSSFSAPCLSDHSSSLPSSSMNNSTITPYQQQSFDNSKNISIPPSSSSIRTSSTGTSWPSTILEDYASTLVIPRSYVSLSDVNAFVAKADSIKHSASIHQSITTFNKEDYPSSPSLASPSWDDINAMPPLPFRSSSPTSSSPSPSSMLYQDKLMIKIPKHHSTPAIATYTSLSSPTLMPSTSSSSSSSSSSGDSYSAEESDQDMQYVLKKSNDGYEMDLEYDDDDDDDEEEEEEEDDDEDENSDDDYEYIRLPAIPTSMRSSSTYLSKSLNRHRAMNKTNNKRHHHSSSTKVLKSKSFVVKKGRNVDKACNHCKRSHLRCDNMRPCQRCTATGKSGCKDVQHKPRGRPKLHKK
ncbi:uncharacterized protein BX664DRAFT_385816 [Halteromyces radiatus]|uniref:uncharacterized protein n=1 Tax=Halteromyces radiatus TaxID=101107 RepID=UPI00221E9592|nr:uncharacterized protein BX664DRAFT_385816 [Halteromyces radiatus]KAI8089310.1 hypothetical protein BX664DRAFT_385816 [Halteromyces radiatus]